MDEEQDDFAAAFKPETTEQEPVAPDPVVEVVPVVEVEPVAEPTPPAPEPEAKPDPQHVPITALLDERDKRKKLEEEIERFKAAQKPAEAPAVPDMFDDPEGFAAYQEQKVQQAVYAQNLRFSERLAAKEYGAETFAKAKEWGIAKCDADPHFNAKVAASDDPYELVVSEWKRDQVASQFNPDDFAQFQAWKAAQSAVQEQTKPAPQAPPRSLASAPSAGGISSEVIPTDTEIFKDAFS